MQSTFGRDHGNLMSKGTYACICHCSHLRVKEIKFTKNTWKQIDWLSELLAKFYYLSEHIDPRTQQLANSSVPDYKRDELKSDYCLGSFGHCPSGSSSKLVKLQLNHNIGQKATGQKLQVKIWLPQTWTRLVQPRVLRLVGRSPTWQH